MMPEIDGFEFAESVRRVNKHIPILFMSATWLIWWKMEEISREQEMVYTQRKCL